MKTFIATVLIACSSFLGPSVSLAAPSDKPAPKPAPPAPRPSKGCFAGEWTGRGKLDHRSMSVKFSVAQQDKKVRATFKWVEFGKERTETAAGENADCAARTVTLREVPPLDGDAPHVYTLTLSADLEQLSDGGTESRLDGTWTVGDERGEIEAYRRNPP